MALNNAEVDRNSPLLLSIAPAAVWQNCFRRVRSENSLAVFPNKSCFPEQENRRK
jgi:hypothetical protein